MTKRKREIILLCAPLAAIAFALWANTSVQSAEERQQARIKHVACAAIIYRADGSSGPCGGNHGMWPRPQTRWELLVAHVRRAVRL